jgi:SAM-dependent methyltransferase
VRLYRDLALWWPLISAPEDYAEEAGVYRRAMVDAATREVRSVLELGSGGGNNASHMKRWFDLTLVEPADAMRAVSASLNPECEHVDGDMRTARLGREFDAVFIHDAIDYMATRDDLRAAIDTAAAHLAPGGAALFCPDHVRETFRPATTHGGHDRGEAGARYLEWLRDPDPDDETCVADFVFLLRHGDAVTIEHDRHTFGLFSRTLWLDAMAAAGLVDVRAVPFEHSEVEPGTAELFVGRAPDGDLR